MEVLPKKNRHFMPWALLLKPSGLQPQHPYSQFLPPTHCGITFSLILNQVAWQCWSSHILCLTHPTCPRLLTYSIA